MSELDDGQRFAAVTTVSVAAAPDRLREPARDVGRDSPRDTARDPAQGAAAGVARDLDTVRFNRMELQVILSLYGRMVAQGEWRDYAIDHLRERAVFSVFRRTSESPLYRIEKQPKLAARQGQYAIVAQGGLILKRGNDLARVIAVVEKRPKLVAV